jgi:hypothetical protein
VTLPEENRTFSGGDGTHLPTIIKSPEARGWTFFGWDIMKHKMKQKSYRNKVLQRSAAVLGYAAHVSFSYEVFLLCSITNKHPYLCHLWNAGISLESCRIFTQIILFHRKNARNRNKSLNPNGALVGLIVMFMLKGKNIRQ